MSNQDINSIQKAWEEENESEELRNLEDLRLSEMISYLSPEGYNVLNIHPEFEGTARIGTFRSFLDSVQRNDIDFLPLGGIAEDILKTGEDNYSALITHGVYSGRSGNVALQGESLN